MRILGIETSCDETSAAVVDNGRTLLSNVIQSQIDIHAAYGGVVPEVAARSHLEVILPVVDEALARADSTWNDIDAIAVTHAPGLIGSLLIGTLTAKTLALLKNKPLYPVHHVEGHMYANFLLEKAPEFPTLALIVSGGHSQLVLFRDHGDYELLGATQDDAVGEAFDKVAKIIGLPYPGGPSIAKAAELGDPHAYKLPISKMPGYNFSFSGLKTAVLRLAQGLIGEDYRFPSTGIAERLTEAQKNDIAASFQYTAVKTLVDATKRAYREYDPASFVIGGGVAASGELRRQLSDALPHDIEYPPMSLCTDNAGMIAALGYYVAQSIPATDPRSTTTIPTLSMKKSAWKMVK